MPAGRPSKYKPEYCEAVIALMGQGFSKTAFAGSIGVARQTILNWANEIPEFLGAIKKAEAGRVYSLEQGLLEAKNSQTVTSRIFALKNADPEEWKDKVQAEGDLTLTVKVLKLAAEVNG